MRYWTKMYVLLSSSSHMVEVRKWTAALHEATAPR